MIFKLYLNEMTAKPDFNVYSYWIGLNDQTKEGEWRWVDDGNIWVPKDSEIM